MTYCLPADVYRKAGVDSTIISEEDVSEHILDAVSEIEEMYGKSYLSSTQETEWFDTSDNPTSSLDEPDKTVIFLSLTPIQSIVSVESYNSDDELETEWLSSDYWVDEKTGELRLRSSIFKKQYHRVKVVYTYGYATIPRKIKNLASVIAAISILIEQIGGTYDDVTSYSLPTGISVGVGEPYMNMVRNTEKLEKELKRIMDTIGRTKMNVVIV